MTKKIEKRIPATELVFATLGARIFKLSPFETQLRFHQNYNTHSAAFARIGLVVGLSLYLFFYLWDRLIDDSQSANALMVRLIVCTMFLAIALLPLSIIARYLQTLMLGIVIVAGVGVVYIISMERDGLNSGLSGVVLVLMFNFGFFRLLFLPSLISGCVIILAYEVAALLLSIDIIRVAANNFFLLSALISGGCITYLLERLFRAQFVSGEELQKERDTHAAGPNRH